MRCGFAAFALTLWLLSGLYCRFVEAHLVALLRRATEKEHSAEGERLPLAGAVAPL